MNTNAIRGVAIAIGILVVGAALLLRNTGSSSTPTTPNPPATATTEPTETAPQGSLEITVAYSPEKEALFKKAFAEFNAQRVQVGGKPVFVVGTKISSGAAFDALRAGKLKPTIWTPSSSLWGRLLTQVGDVPWIPDENVSFVRTPLVIAMWEQQARALGWPQKPLGWADVLAEGQNPQGWSKYGHPEWGAFRLGHTNPDFSTSGLSAVAAEYYAATGKKEGLTLTDLQDPKVRAYVQGIQSSIVHYGDTTLFFAEQLAKRGPAYASAVAMEETTIVDFNVRLRKGGQKLVSIYPKEGTFFSDDPLIVLNADWVSAEQKEAAQKLIDYLLSPTVQARVGDFGFRPSDLKAKATGNLTAANGVDVAQPKQLFSLPDPRVLAKLKELWHEDRKPADVILVVDVSGSMFDESKLIQAQQGLKRFLASISPRDRLGLIAFNDQVFKLKPLAEMTPANRNALESSIEGLQADGDTAVYDATLQAIDEIKKSADPKHIQAVVLLTDGMDTASTASFEDVLKRAGGSAGGEELGARLFTIAYGSDANADELTQIANASGGKEYKGDPETIDSVYTSISSFF